MLRLTWTRYGLCSVRWFRRFCYLLAFFLYSIKRIVRMSTCLQTHGSWVKLKVRGFCGLCFLSTMTRAAVEIAT